jgi:plastocyanin
VTNVIPNGKDDFTSDFLAIQQGGTVSWHNADTDAHFVSAVPGWSGLINAMNIGVQLLKASVNATTQCDSSANLHHGVVCIFG